MLQCASIPEPPGRGKHIYSLEKITIEWLKINYYLIWAITYRFTKNICMEFNDANGKLGGDNIKSLIEM